MASGDVQVQSAVHSLDQGLFALLIKGGTIAVLVIFVSLLYLFVQFKGLSNPSAMDQAQIARNLASGKGYTTGTIRPAALAMYKNHLSAPVDQIDLSRFPDFYQAPLNPWLNSFALRLIKDSWKMSPTQIPYSGDRMVAATAMITFLLAIGVWFFVIQRLFDTKLAFFAIMAAVVTDLLWQFSLSGLPQMLVLLLFGLASLATLFAMEAAENDQFTHTLGWLVGAGALFGLMTLAHGLAFWLFAGWAVFAAIYFRPRGLAFLAALAAFLVIVTPWMVRTYQVCGNPLGLGFYEAFFEENPTEGYQRASELTLGGSGISIQGKVRANLVRQLEGLFGLLGLNIAAGSFFLALFHRFRSHKAAMFKWCVLAMWISAVFGMSLYRGYDPMSENQFHVIFIPIFAAFGFAFLLVLWNRLEFGGALFRVIFICAVIFLCGVPLLMTLFAGQQGRIQWPPYVPPVIGMLGEWFDEDEAICSDMPWAVAWYAQRPSLLMPKSIREFNRIHDYNETKQPINGLFLTPISGNQRLFADIYKGNLKDWAPLVTRPPKVDGFPLTSYTALPIEAECIIFADRDRWSQPRSNQ